MKTPASYHRRLAAAVAALLAAPAHAIDMNALNAGKDFAGQMNTTNPATTTQPADVVPNYNPNPPQTAYAANPDAMNADAAAEFGTNPAATYVTDSMNNRPLVVIDPRTDPLITAGQAAVDNAEVLIGQYQGCQPVTQQVPGAVTEKICHEYAPTQTLTCDKTLNVDVQATAVENCTRPYAAYAVAARLYSESFRGADTHQFWAYCEPQRQDNIQRFYVSVEGAWVGDIELPIDPVVPISNLHVTQIPTVTLVGAICDPENGCSVAPTPVWTGGMSVTADKVFVRKVGPYGNAYDLYYTGGCDAAGKCNYAFYVVDANPNPTPYCVLASTDGGVPGATYYFEVCTEVPGLSYLLANAPGVAYFRADVSFDRPKTTWNYTVSEAWANGCAALEARAQ